MKRLIRATTMAALFLAVAMSVAAAQPDPPPPGDSDGGWSAPDGGNGGHGGSWGGWRGGRPGMMGGRGMGMMLLGPEGRLLRGQGWLADQLKLTTQQRDRLRDIGDNLMRQEIKSRSDLALARLDLAKLLRSDSPSQSALDTKINDITGIQGDMLKAGVSAKLQVRGVLTPDQRKQLQELRPPRPAMGGSGPRGGGQGHGNRAKGT